MISQDAELFSEAFIKAASAEEEERTESHSFSEEMRVPVLLLGQSWAALVISKSISDVWS